MTEQETSQSVTSKTTVPPEAGSVPAEPAFSDAGTERAGESAGIVTERRRANQTPPAGGDGRKASEERRYGVERRAVDIGSPTGLERRRGPGRRRSDDRRSAEEGEMTDEQFEFVLAVDTYKRLNNRPFPTWTEILEVVKQLGYRKVAASSVALPAGTARGHTRPAAAAPAATGGTAVKPSDYMPG